MIVSGKLVLVVGPSGAGKDTLINIAKVRCAGDRSILFSRRVITRPVSAAEDHDSISAETFDVKAKAGAFAFHWEAHGLKYGIPVTVNDHLRNGGTVVCNVSRGLIEAARMQYAHCVVVFVTASKEILAARLSNRDRASDGNPSERISRKAPSDQELAADVVIQNVGSADEGVEKLIDVLRAI
jgi:ribose 1,5-bisphosphokinase